MARGCWSCVGQMCSLMPDPKSVSVEKFRAKMEGTVGDDVHLHPAPPGSLLMLGYIALRVPDEERARLFYTLGLGFRRSPKEESWHEVRVNGGLSQFRLSFASSSTGIPHSRAQCWPGTIRIWVKDHRDAAEKIRRFGNVDEMMPAAAGGQFRFVVKDIFRANIFHVEEAPLALMSRLEALSADPFSNQVEQNTCTICLDELVAEDDRRSLSCNHTFHAVCIKEWLERANDCPVCKASVDGRSALESNVLAIVEITYKIPFKGAASALVRFFTRNLMAAAEQKPATAPGCHICLVHLSPGPGLHQTMSFEEDMDAAACSDPGIVCIYMATLSKFRVAYVLCKNDGIVSRPSSWKDAEREGEFQINCCVDPDSGEPIILLQHVIRSPMHPECPVKAVEQ